LNPKRGRPKKGEESFSDQVYKVCLAIWRNGYKPFYKQNIIDYFEGRLNQHVDLRKITSALMYLKSKGLVINKEKNKWYIPNRKIYPDASVQRYYYQYHPLPRCLDCIWMKHKMVKEASIDENGDIHEINKKEAVCTCPYSMHYNKVVDAYIARPECITTKPYVYQGYLGEKDIYKKGFHVKPFYPKKYFKLKDGKVVWKGD